ncbi:MAG: hypothetical protein ACRDBM_03195 [Sporomusa sp.]
MPETDYKINVLKINLDKARFGVNALALAGNGTELGAESSWKNRGNAINAGDTKEKNVWYVGEGFLIECRSGRPGWFFVYCEISLNLRRKKKGFVVFASNFTRVIIF